VFVLETKVTIFADFNIPHCMSVGSPIKANINCIKGIFEKFFLGDDLSMMKKDLPQLLLLLW
jgi:hypothetical protein